LDKRAFLRLAKYAGYFALFFVLSRARVMGVLSPCFFGLFVSLVFLDNNVYYLSLAYLSSVLLNDPTTYSIIFSLSMCVCLSIVASVMKKRGKIFATWKNFLLCLGFGALYVALNTTSLTLIYISIINAFLNALFMLCCSNFFKIVKNRKFNLNLNADEIVCGMLILALVFCALVSFEIPFFDIVKFLGYAVILFSLAVIPGAFSVVVAIVMGLGTFLNAGQLQYITLFSIVSAFTYIFKNQNKIFAVISLLAIDLSLNLFMNLFGEFDPLSLVPTVTAGAIFLAIPTKVFQNIRNNLFLDNSNNTLKNILNQNKLQTSKKLLYASEVFFEMDKSFRKLVKGSVSETDAKNLLCGELIRENCENCPQRLRCLKGFNSELKRIFESLINTGFEKGKITLVDLPQYLTTRCVKLNNILNSINTLLADYKNYTKVNLDLDSSKLLIAEQLKGVSNVLANLSCQTRETVTLDHRFEKQIKETLIYNDIVPNEVVCFEKDEQTSVVSMILRNIDFDNAKIEKILNSIFRHKMVQDEILPSENSGLTYVSYKTAPVYDVAVGLAKETKGGMQTSGDTHAMTKLPSGKILLAICDGMGSGKVASEKSETSINLIENFYRVGFDNETIIQSVNKLLNLTSSNVFSAMDISVIDLKNGEVDFIKQGATVGFIKRNEEVLRIESNTLPLGILDEVKPNLTKTVLTPDDIVVMMSDGVVDAFGEDDLVEYLRRLPSSSPQNLADTVLNRAKERQQNFAQDDMTVLCGKLFYNYV
jgi:stage II sporulation protein E